MIVSTPNAERTIARVAFTLMEMLVVVAIIVALAGVGGFFLFGQLNQSKKGVAKLKIRNLTTAAEIYTNNNNEFPPSLDALFVPDPAGRPPIMKNIQDKYDPWGREFQYNRAGTYNNGLQPDIWCEVPDSGGELIGNW